jgi:2-dehydropantoate 2-reductase
MGKRIVVVGAGAVGGYAGGHMARNGADVTFVDPWPEHVNYIREKGIQLSGTTEQERFSVPVKALHLTEVQQISKERPVDIAFICMKSYDTEWATTLIRPYLAEDGYVVSLQNCINEERIARIVGWGKTMGCIASMISVELEEPGHVVRNVELGGEKHTVFRVGEVHGRTTARATEVAELMKGGDSSKVTANLWGERWSKLCINTMRNGLSASTGMNGIDRDTEDFSRDVSLRLAGEAIRVGRALGYDIESLGGMQTQWIVDAAAGDTEAQNLCRDDLLEQCKHRTLGQRPSMGQDIRKGRRTEIDFINGFIVDKGREVGIDTPVNAALVDLVKRVERGELAQSPDNVRGI